MSGILGGLVPARFCALVCHGIVTVSYYFMKVDCIQVTLAPVSRHNPRREVNRAYRRALRRVNIVLFWSWGCFIVEFLGLLAAYSLTWPRVMLSSVACHAVGAFACAWAQIDGWTFVAAEYIFVFFTFFPALLEVAVSGVSARAHWIELHAYTGSAKSTPPKVPFTLSQLLQIAAGVVCAVIGLPLLITSIHRSLETDRLLEVSAWVSLGMVFSAVSLCVVLANQKLKLLGKNYFHAPVLAPPDNTDYPKAPFVDGSAAPLLSEDLSSSQLLDQEEKGGAIGAEAAAAPSSLQPKTTPPGSVGSQASSPAAPPSDDDDDDDSFS
mmetsp:Transcript_5428/g.17094  ORF Transcript_5428/g.17094 Transcript_5428/m.17094 type:complete len:324 (-) Transcript_5428:56-1027(-)